MLKEIGPHRGEGDVMMKAERGVMWSEDGKKGHRERRTGSP